MSFSSNLNFYLSIVFSWIIFTSAVVEEDFSKNVFFSVCISDTVFRALGPWRVFDCIVAFSHSGWCSAVRVFILSIA